MVLKGLMTTSIDRLDPSSTVMEACRVMDRKKVGAVVVVEDHKLCGILTHQDLVERVMLAKRDPETTPVRDVMTREVVALTDEHSYGDALKLMVKHDYTYLPVVDDAGSLCGMVSLRDLLGHRIEDLAWQLDSVTRYFSANGIGGD